MLDFIQHHQPFQRLQSQHRIAQPGHRAGVFQVEESARFGGFPSDPARQRGLAYLPSPENRHYRVMFQQLPNGMKMLQTVNHAKVLP
jgi:hypothetical protein